MNVKYSVRCLATSLVVGYLYSCLNVKYSVRCWPTSIVAGNLHSCLNVKYSVRWRHSWLPRSRNNVVGWLIFSVHKYNTH